MLVGMLQLGTVCQSTPSIVALQPHYVLVDAVYTKLRDFERRSVKFYRY